MKCFYHATDLDGQCSGAIIRQEFPECELIGITYSDAFFWNIIQPNETIIMVDFALQPFEDMLKLDKACDLIWIDHHLSSIEESDRHGFHPKGWWKIGEAACELTWQYFVSPDLPLAVYLIGRHDVWDHSDYRTLAFHYGMQKYNTQPSEDDFWRELLHSSDNEKLIDSFIRDGDIILEYVRRDNAKYVKACSFDVTLDDYQCIAANKMLCGSQLFESIWDGDQYDIMLAFGYKSGRWNISLYTDRADIDVSQIAKKWGGGGHKGAAGFQADTLPFLPSKRTRNQHKPQV